MFTPHWSSNKKLLWCVILAASASLLYIIWMQGQVLYLLRIEYKEHRHKDLQGLAGMELISFQTLLCFGFVTKAMVMAQCCGMACMVLGLPLFPTLPQQKEGWGSMRYWERMWPGQLTQNDQRDIPCHRISWVGRVWVFPNVDIAWALTRCQYQCACGRWVSSLHHFLLLYSCLMLFSFFFLVPSHLKLCLSQPPNFLAFVLPILSLSDSDKVAVWGWHVG